MGRRDAMVWRVCYLGAVGVWVGVGHMGGHVAVVLVIMSACSTPLLVHIGVVCVGWRHRVEMVGGVVCSGCLTGAGGAVGGRHPQLV